MPVGFKKAIAPTKRRDRTKREQYLLTILAVRKTEARGSQDRFSLSFIR
ncbi:MAG: hypothetical protein V7L04_14050 [Nostoc sp.]